MHYSAGMNPDPSLDPSGFLLLVGDSIRRRRKAAGISRKELAARSEISERFLADVEHGRANPSILRLARLAKALDTSPGTFLTPGSAETGDTTRRPVVALLGLRGAGKSTVGARLARELGARFLELDALVEEAVGLTLPEVFEVHGEAFYRDAEYDVLASVLSQKEKTVLATGGGVVTSTSSFDLLHQRSHTVWLKAKPEEHWSRVVAQGDTRPMAGNDRAFNDLCGLLERREKLYARAEHTVDTSNRSVDEITHELLERYQSH